MDLSSFHDLGFDFFSDIKSVPFRSGTTVQCTVIGNSIFSSYERIYFYMGENSAVWTNLAQWVDLGSSGMGSFTFGG